MDKIDEIDRIVKAYLIVKDKSGCDFVKDVLLDELYQKLPESLIIKVDYEKEDLIDELINSVKIETAIKSFAIGTDIEYVTLQNL